MEHKFLCGVGVFKLERKAEQIMKKTTITTLRIDQQHACRPIISIKARKVC
jgi:hypothetical protein